MFCVVTREMVICREYCVGNGVVDEEGKSSPASADGVALIPPDKGVGGERTRVGGCGQFCFLYCCYEGGVVCEES